MMNELEKPQTKNKKKVSQNMNTKKILAALAVAGCALQLPAIVESANIVG